MARKAILTRCDACDDGGYIIAWQTSDKILWGRILETIKSVPREEREFIPDEKAWWLSDWAYTYLTRSIQFGKKKGRSQQGPSPFSLPKEITEAYQVLCITSDAPLELVKASQRILAKKYHPDTGGSHTAMVAINNAADTIIAWLEQGIKKGA